MPGVGPKTERRLWAAGVHSWREGCARAAAILSQGKAESVAHHCAESIQRLARQDARYFHERLPSNEQWRLFPEFRHSAAYLDIETTGLGPPHDYVTTIALYDGKRIRHYIHDENMDDFREDIEPYRLIVTYNGKTFDAPFLRQCLGVRMDQAHIDLRYVLGSLGIKGGLKGCERQLGLDRGDLEGVDGYLAVLLWHDYRRNANEKALQTLLAYNVQDTVTLETLMVLAYNMKLKQTGFAAGGGLSLPPAPKNPFRPDVDTISRLRSTVGWP